MSKELQLLTKNILKKGQENTKKGGCSLCKSEKPLFKNISSEKKNILITFRIKKSCKVLE